MHFDIRNIKHFEGVVDTTSLLAAAKAAKTTSATVGKINASVYETTHSEWCTAEFIDYTLFEEEVEQLVIVCQEIVTAHFSVTCEVNDIHFLKYNTGAYYKPHIDGQYIEGKMAKRALDRDVTCVVYLNQDYEGGKVNFNFFNKLVKPNAGDILVYPTTWQYMHSVEKVQGERFAIVIWFKTDPELNKDCEIKNIEKLRLF